MVKEKRMVINTIRERQKNRQEGRKEDSRKTKTDAAY